MCFSGKLLHSILFPLMCEVSWFQSSEVTQGDKA